MPPPFVLPVAADFLRSGSQFSARSSTAIRATSVALPQGPSLRSGLYCPGPSSLTRPHPPHSQAHRDFAASRLIRDVHAVRERSSDPRVVPGFRVLFLPLMSSSRTPGSPRQALFQPSRRSIGLRHRGNGSALPTSPPSASGGGGISGLPGSLPLRPDRLLASPRRIRPGSAARPIHDPKAIRSVDEVPAPGTLTASLSLQRLLLPGFRQVGHPPCCWVSLRQ